MFQIEISDKYFKWLYYIACGDEEQMGRRLSYWKLFKFLHSIEFTYSIDLDENRAQDGIDFRYRFGHEHGYSRTQIAVELDNAPCSVLEMMVALAFRVEEQIMTDEAYGDRTGQWFWNMINSLGLGSMNDNEFNERYCYFIISKFLDRNYSPNGRGGLFVIENCDEDLRDVEIWTQCMWYLNEI